MVIAHASRPTVGRFAPAAVGAAAVAAVSVIALRDPNDEGSYPACPFRAMTGLDCPGCGALRAVHALATGHPGRAAGHNILLVAAVPVALFHYMVWARPRWAASSPFVELVRRPLGRPATGWAVVVAVVAFTVLRNLAWAPFSVLAS